MNTVNKKYSPLKFIISDRRHPSIALTALLLISTASIAVVRSAAGDGSSEGFVSTTEPAFVASYEILHSFMGNSNAGIVDGANPYSPLMQAPDGNFYGTTYLGGAMAGGGAGSVFKMDNTGKITILHSFVTVAIGDGANPYGGLTLAKDGNFYGTTYSALGVTGSGQNGGVVFRISPAGAYTKLFTFTGVEGGHPKAGLIQAKDGYLYGTTIKGGYLAGAVYKMATNGTPALLHAFKGTTDGVQPTCNLLHATDGNLYGTTYAGGGSGVGTVFKLTTAGGFAVIHTFKGSAALDGSNPVSGLIQTTDGSIYGTTAAGGQSNAGTIFKIDPSGAYSVVYSFKGLEGARPWGDLLQANDGNLYGTTHEGGRGYGTVFKITLTGTFTLLHTFGEVSGDGGAAAAGLIQGTDGKLYGTTNIGGKQNKGVVFRLDLGLRPITTPTPTPTPTPLSSPSPVSSPPPGPSPSPTSSPTPQPSPSPAPVCSENSCGEVHANGRLETRTDGTSFKIDVRADNSRRINRGDVEFYDREKRMRFRSTAITCLVISGEHATISGTGVIDGLAVTFKVEIEENPRSQLSRFSISLSNGFQRSGVPHAARVNLRPCRSAAVVNTPTR
jgi:uncharacterized repeat protein (TIGR03803 family)